ncbi:MAG: NeuD/PglB/VioB family sugar acetyltransferase [Flavobacteriaceae bacterium]|nr:NeuD/PglB/VioB family sugar acetyltransferase [Flavobacteriaceae bacterium]
MSEKKIRLYGAGGHSQVVREILEDNGYEITDTFDDKPEGSHYATKKIASGARGDLSTFSHEGPPVIIAVGINKHRAEIANFLKSKFEKAIHKSAIIASSASIGEGTVIIAGAIINPNSIVGKHVLINTAASIGHDCVIGDFTHISPKAALCGHVEVGEGSHVGVGAVVIPKVKIGKWCTIGAGTVVIKDIPDYTTVVGNPGKIIKTMKMENINESQQAITDITFIGSGISSSFTLLNLLDKIELENTPNKVIINVIDKYSEFNTGVPYGLRSGFSVLLITSLKDFLPEPELGLFKKWLNNNKKWLLDKFKKDGGELSKKWLEEHTTQIENNDWNDLFIPRSFFGIYITERVKRKVEVLKIEGLAEVKYVNAEVIDIEKNEGGFDLTLNNDSNIYTKKAILSIGSLPINYLWKSKKMIEKENLLFVNNPYSPNLKEVLSKIESFLSKRNNKINALIVGTNASGLEMLYKLNDIKQIRDKINNFTFLSTQGMIPNAIVDEERAKDFVTTNLNALQSKKGLTAKEIADAAFKDLDYAEKIELGAASTVGKISTGFGSLLHKLNENELKEFACCYGNEIGRRQRCAGDHYLRTIVKLKGENRFEHLAGRFDGIKMNIENEFKLDYLETESNKVKVLDEPIHLVINCVGSMRFTNEKTPSLIKNLINKKYCTPNKSQIGFNVNEDFESIEGLHIMGPLLAGNIIEGKPIWHVEHCGRIIWLSKLLAEIVCDKTLITKEVDG